MPLQKLTEILNFVEFTGKLGTAGQPRPEQFAIIAEAGYTTIVNLATPDSRRGLENEEKYATVCGLTYINIPVVWENPTLRDVQQFFAVMDARPNAKIFLHCIVNYRATAFAFLYSVLQLGMPVAEAKAIMHQVWEPYDAWQRFIDTVLAAYNDTGFAMSAG